MSVAIRCAAATVIISAALVIAGCGGTTIDQVKLEDTTRASLEGSLHEKIKNVDCPSGLSVDPGSTFTCDVTFPDAKQMTATLEIRDKDADITIVGLKANK
ncbi:MAG TPA: DUF4333 domain-containing protein [Solirubrobacterales bacterium]|jgi:NAD(P)H-hydrate repair Nnr-like enzyme with NAD(P)H-hydrate epimerase domain|nr:DUF4333 domain-containing protein [Solirubrobacterales bacterium]